MLIQEMRKALIGKQVSVFFLKSGEENLPLNGVITKIIKLGSKYNILIRLSINDKETDLTSIGFFTNEAIEVLIKKNLIQNSFGEGGKDGTVIYKISEDTIKG